MAHDGPHDTGPDQSGPADHRDSAADNVPQPGWPALDGLVTSVLSTRQEIAALQAREARLLAGAVELVVARTRERRQASTSRAFSDLPLREVSLELGAAMRVSDRTVQARMGDADALVSRFSATLAAWESGRIDAGHAWAIVKAGSPITDDAARARFEVLALAAAATESPGRLAAVARALAAAVDPGAFAARLRLGAEDRAVRVYDIEDGLARLVADLPAPLAYAIRDRLTQMARTVLADGGCDANADTANADIDTDADADACGGSAGPAAGDADDSAVSAGRSGGSAGDEDHARRAGADQLFDEGRRAEGRTRVVTGPAGGGPRTAAPDAATHATDGDPDERTLDQVRADVLADLLLAGAPAGHGRGETLAAIAGHVQVTIPVLTLAGVGDEPALLAGYGPIDPAIARRLAAAAPGWDRVLVDAHSGAPLAVDRYRPSAELVRFLAARDERCRTPGCTRLTRRCDVDHTTAHSEGGSTTEDNLANFCRRHHVGKHGTAWRVRQLGRGVLEWTSPTGRRHLDRPPATLRFVPATDALDIAPF